MTRDAFGKYIFQAFEWCTLSFFICLEKIIIAEKKFPLFYYLLKIIIFDCMGEYFDPIGQKLILNKSTLYDQMNCLRSLSFPVRRVQTLHPHRLDGRFQLWVFVFREQNSIGSQTIDHGNLSMSNFFKWKKILFDFCGPGGSNLIIAEISKSAGLV